MDNDSIRKTSNDFLKAIPYVLLFTLVINFIAFLMWVYFDNVTGNRNFLEPGHNLFVPLTYILAVFFYALFFMLVPLWILLALFDHFIVKDNYRFKSKHTVIFVSCTLLFAIGYIFEFFMIYG